MSKYTFPENATYKETLAPAMEIDNEADATQYMTDLAEWHVSNGHKETFEEALQLVVINIGYYAGYYSAETRARVYELFNVEHPIFGKSEPSPEEAFVVGKKYIEKLT